MIRTTRSRLVLSVIALAALMVGAEPAAAQHGGVRGGGFTGGGYHGGVYRGGFGGHHYGYHPYYGYRGYIRPYYPSYGYRFRPYYGYGSYPYYFDNGQYPYYYGSGYYPSYDDGSRYYPPDSSNNSDATNDPPATSPVSTDLGTANPLVQTGTDNSARITVRLPDNANLWFDGTQMTTTGSVRQFVSPPLTSGQRYTYEVRARWTDSDRIVEQKQTVVVTAGAKVEVNFPAPSGSGEKTPQTPRP
ncbi:MAG TPA: TIGR03000 domain-containing protein [Gemmataceae bacterium]|nr:TIGR03000 domain-containing protein [Gemmataceae bacterium]